MTDRRLIERPILFNAEMVRAILDGRKTATRRPMKPQPFTPSREYRDRWGVDLLWSCAAVQSALTLDEAGSYSPFGYPGDELWVRETWQEFFEDEVPAARRGPMGRMGIPANPSRRSCVAYRADGELASEKYGRASWRPSIHMPRWASRIQLRVAYVAVERVQDITEFDVRSEGFDSRDAFLATWRGIYGPDLSAWVWVVRFSVLEPTP